MKKNNLLSGALILSVGGILAKVFSAIYRIGLTRILGGEGIGIYQLIFPFYSLCVVLATAGLPMAISKVVARRKENSSAIIKKCLLYITLISLAITFVLLISSPLLASIQGEKKITICYIVLAPTIIIISASSVLRGYFQGRQNFTPSAVSNIVEQFVKLVAGLVLTLSLIGAGVINAVIGAIIGIAISEIISIVVLILYLRKYERKNVGKVNVTFKELFKDILPITLTNVILPISMFVDSIIVVNLLSVNFSKTVSIFLYGIESGAVATIVTLPTIFSFAIASVILPSITISSNILNKTHNLGLAIKIVLIICIPCVLCFTFIPSRILNVLYGSRLNAFGIDGTVIGSRLLTISGFGLVFLAINQLFSSALQAVDCRYVTIRNMGIAVLVKLLLEIVFLPSKILNIYVLSIANTVCYVTVMVLNHTEINSKFNLKLNFDFTGKLVLSNFLMLLSLLSVLAIKNSVINTIFAIFVAMCVYFVCLWYFKIFSKTDKAILKYKV